MMMMLSCTLMGPGLGARSTAWSPILANRGRGRGSIPGRGNFEIGDGDGDAGDSDGDGDRVHGVRALACWPIGHAAAASTHPARHSPGLGLAGPGILHWHAALRRARRSRAAMLATDGDKNSPRAPQAQAPPFGPPASRKMMRLLAA